MTRPGLYDGGRVIALAKLALFSLAVGGACTPKVASESADKGNESTDASSIPTTTFSNDTFPLP